MEYQNFYIVLCCLIIYSCCKTNIIGFLSIVSLTYILVLLDEQDKLLHAYDFEKTNGVSAKAVDEQKVTKNPRKENNESDTTNLETAVENESNIVNVKQVDIRESDKKPSPYQQSYEQRKRLLESVYKDLEQDNKWKRDGELCRSIRSDSSVNI